MENLYPFITKRKSMRTFNPALSISEEEKQAFLAYTASLEPLDSQLPIKFTIIDKSETERQKFGQLALVAYGNKKDEKSLINAGYMLEQMDLYLATQSIGCCWYGLARPKKMADQGLRYIIMMALGKSRPEDFRKDVTEFNRKPIDEFWEGEFLQKVKEDVRLTPSACNSQSWRVKSTPERIDVYRTLNYRSIMPKPIKEYFNPIDLGIFLCFLELSLKENGFSFTREILEGRDESLIKVASYQISK